jgi:hypothetical protein
MVAHVIKLFSANPVAVSRVSIPNSCPTKTENNLFGLGGTGHICQ